MLSWRDVREPAGNTHTHTQKILNLRQVVSEKEPKKNEMDSSRGLRARLKKRTGAAAEKTTSDRPHVAVLNKSAYTVGMLAS